MCKFFQMIQKSHNRSHLTGVTEAIPRNQELAEYEKVSDHVKVTQKDLEQDGFSKNPFFHGIIAEVPEQHKTKEGHTKIGYALYFYAYSSWSGRAIYMEDLYVMPEFRGKGVGKALMSKVAQLGLAAGCHQLNFAVLDWNKPSMDFYLSQGCFDITDTMGYHCLRCEGEALKHLAQL
uniref:N-acetyltransferase domain-containing protein n=1 Tax=Oreochromis aureus TaxID=47969 RepID=A0AAZ1XX10_OREAU